MVALFTFWLLAFHDEAPVVEPVVSVYREAARSGVHRTVHAAETSDCKAVSRAYYELGSERIGHGYHVVEDDQLYRRCIQDRVHFEGCPYSSILSGSVKTGGSSHPIVRFAKDGANFSINSDDPTITGHFVTADYQLLSSWGLADDHFLQANINAATSSFLDLHSKKALIKNLKNTNGFHKE